MGAFNKGLNARKKFRGGTRRISNSLNQTGSKAVNNSKEFRSQFRGGKTLVSKGLPENVNPLTEAPDGIGATADEGFSDTKKIAAVPRIANPMHKFNRASTVFTLCALTLDEVNFPDETILKNPPKYIAAKSAGGSARDTALADEAKLEFYIDNVEIDAIVHSNPATGHTQGTKLNFTVHEPFSLGLFLSNLQLQVGLASGSREANYLSHPMALIMEIKGAVDEDLTPLEQAQLRRVIPIQIIKVNFGNSNGISNYEVQAVVFNDIAYSDQYATIATDVEIKGETLEQIMFSGEQSLARYLNEKNIDNKPGFFAKYFGKKPKPVAIRDYIFLFPDEQLNASAGINKGAESSGQSLVTDTGDLVTDSQYSYTVERTFQNLFKELSYSVASGFNGKQYNPNKIGRSKMITEYFKNSRDSGKSFGDDKIDVTQYYDKVTKSYRRGSAKIDFTTKSIAFKKGTNITKIIEDLILLSEYGQSILKRKKESETGLINWFKIVPSRYVFRNETIQKQYNTNPEVIMFRVLPYGVPDDKFMAPDDVSRIPNLDYLVRKQYDVIYTGKNKDVIDFNVEFNSAFFTALQNDLGNNSPDNKDGASSSVKQKKKTAGMNTAGNTYSPINPAIGFGDPSLRDGGDAETLELRFARQFNEAILNSDVDLVKIDLQIVGDPYYVPQSGLGNYISRGYYALSDQRELFLDGDASANFLQNVVLTKINFRTPIDIDGEGKMAFSKIKAENELQTLGEFSGFYYPIRVRSTFSGNKFVQELEMIRVKTGPFAQDDNVGDRKTEVQDPYELSDGFEDLGEDWVNNNLSP